MLLLLCMTFSLIYRSFCADGFGGDRIKWQLGGNNPDTLAEVADMCEQWDFSEINLNCGCPSSKVSDRCFGARLMLVRVPPFILIDALLVPVECFNFER